MIIGFLSGLFIGAVAGVAVMSLCAAAKESEDSNGHLGRSKAGDV